MTRTATFSATTAATTSQATAVSNGQLRNSPITFLLEVSSTSGARADAMPKLYTSCDCTSAWVACRPAISTTTAGTSVIRRRIVGVILGETRS